MRFLCRSLAMLFFLPMAARVEEGVKPPGNPAEIYEEVDLGKVSAIVSAFRVGHGQLTLTGQQIRVTPIQAKGQTLGLYFQGSVQMDYRTTNTLEFPRLEYNLTNCTNLKPGVMDGTRIVRDVVTEGILWGSVQEMPFLNTLSGGVPPEGTQSAFLSLRKRYARADMAPLAHILSLAGDGPAPFAAELRGDEQWVYAHDSRDTGEQTLLLLLGWRNSDLTSLVSDLKGLLRPFIISRQNEARNWKQPQVPPYQLSHVRMDLAALKNDTVTLKVEETITPLRSGFQHLQFDLLQTTYAWLGRGLEPRYLHLRKVTDEKGRALGFSHQHGQLLVGLMEPTLAKVPFKLSFEIDGNFLVRDDNDDKWDLRPGDWFPTPGMGGQYYTLDARIAVQKPLLPMASADTVSRSTEGEFNILNVKSGKPISFFSVTGGKFKVTEETRNGLTVRVANYAMVNSQTPRVIQLTFDVIEFYEKILGPFPLKELTIVEQNDWGYGQAPAGLIYITKEAFNQTHNVVNQLFSRGINARFAHEIAHQYWGTQVKMPSPEEQWITESFAEYTSALFMLRAKGKDYYDRMVQEWYLAAKESNDHGTIPFANELHNEGVPAQSRIDRRNLIYDKGAYLLYLIHQQIGNQDFVTFLRSCQASFRWKFATTENVNGLLKVVAKRDFADFLNQNYWGQGLPEKK